MNRFYKSVSTGPAGIGGTGEGYAVLLDNRPVRTPGKSLMVAPNAQLAQAVADEWAAQIDVITPETMPLTQLLTTVIDRAAYRADIAASLMTYIDSDLLCYPADEPASLSDEQTRIWSPHLAWFEERFGVKMETTYGLSRLDQPKTAHDAVRAVISDLDIHNFTVLQTVTSVTGSIVLGLALMEGVIDADTAWRGTLCEELFYERAHDLERYGLDPIEGKRREGMLRDLKACVDYIRLTSL